ncbi:MAG TPA: hypothetical protein DEA62_03815 [Coxiellaceae bacterium]|nr:hypothetical protein [Coxiellaceae bacterium]
MLPPTLISLACFRHNEDEFCADSDKSNDFAAADFTKGSEATKNKTEDTIAVTILLNVNIKILHLFCFLNTTQGSMHSEILNYFCQLFF